MFDSSKNTTHHQTDWLQPPSELFSIHSDLNSLKETQSPGPLQPRAASAPYKNSSRRASNKSAGSRAPSGAQNSSSSKKPPRRRNPLVPPPALSNIGTILFWYEHYAGLSALADWTIIRDERAAAQGQSFVDDQLAKNMAERRGVKPEETNKKKTKETPVSSKNAPAVPSNLMNQAIIANGFVFTSGGVAMDPETGKIIDGDIEAHTASQKLEVNIYLSDMKYYTKMNEVYSEYWGDLKPARTCVAVKSLPMNANIEINPICRKPASSKQNGKRNADDKTSEELDDTQTSATQGAGKPCIGQVGWCRVKRRLHHVPVSIELRASVSEFISTVPVSIEFTIGSSVSEFFLRSRFY
ncbi:endoribonuclease l-psp [Fusarium longipes]|uniref:Endoribonuclease l-psp n=1 Tax=Fusarium longipes TaxID=694270 RepID=A0A395S0Z0_9HYPO|nr:endoribonuclease l-psp [Fusarium longipes]